MSVKSFGFNQRLAHQTETALAAMLGWVIECGLLNACGSRENVQLAVGQNAVYVEEKEFDFLGAG